MFPLVSITTAPAGLTFTLDSGGESLTVVALAAHHDGSVSAVILDAGVLTVARGGIVEMAA